MNLNWIDAAILILLALYAWQGLHRGFLSLALDLAALALSFLIALNFYPLLATTIQELGSMPPGLAKAGGFLLLGLLSGLVLFGGASWLYTRLPEGLRASRINRLLGVLPATFNGLLLSAFLLSALVVLPLHAGLRRDILASPVGSRMVEGTAALERQLRRAFGETLAETLMLFTLRPAAVERVDLHFTVSQVRVDPEAEERMLALINAERAKAGLPVLIMDEDLRRVARAHSEDMLRRGYFSHSTPEGKSPSDRLIEASISFGVAGENIALAPDVAVAHAGLMESPGHRENILSPAFRRVGIGAMDGGIYGVMFTQEFTD
ncbi:MAG: CvpA family protein [Chloroflexi bacterium]|nr:CvpA family protein [Chloroflexota bacterium]